jgi:hypothetical protein
MSERSALNKYARAVFALALAIAGPCMADVLPKDDPDEPLLRYRTTADIHGLYEIREEARSFLRSQPRKKAGAWVAVGPDIRAQVPLCAVPLRSRWARASDHRENMPAVLVLCQKSIGKKAGWSVFIDAYIPALSPPAASDPK